MILSLLFMLFTVNNLLSTMTQEALAANIEALPIEPSSLGPVNSILTGIASYYDYSLDGHGEWSKSHNTCAFHHQKKDYQMYRVCNLDNGKCVDCYNNDWMRREDRLVDLSSHAFRQIGSTKLGLLRVSVEKIE